MKPRSCHVLLDLKLPGGLPSSGTSEIRLFSKCRNERLRLPAFLQHYRAMGVQRFFIVDNASTDGSTSYLSEQPDVHVFRTDGSFREARGGTDWLNALLAAFGGSHWCVTVDVDELLVYPGSETAGLATLTAYLDKHGYQALECLLLDLYPSGSLGACRYTEGQSLPEAAPFFDSGPYKRFPHDQCPGVLIYGGVRERVFFPESRNGDFRRRLHVALYHRLLPSIPLALDLDVVRSRRPVFPPCLTKVPLVRWDERSSYLNVNHFVSPKKVAPESGVLLHFKFLQDFHERARAEAQRGEYYDGAIEFRRYAEKLRLNPDVTLRGSCSLRFEDSGQLVRMALMRDSDAWASDRA